MPIDYKEVEKTIKEYKKEKTQVERVMGRGIIIDFFSWVNGKIQTIKRKQEMV